MNVEDQLQYRDTHNQTEEKKADSSESNASDWGDNEDDSASKAGALRELKKNGNLNEFDGTENTGESQDLRSAVQSKRSGIKDKANKANKAVEAALSRVSAATSSLLKAAWENLIDSWGITLIWIDIHVFANQVFGDKMFCKLGEEWIPANVSKSLDDGKGDKLAVVKLGANLIESMGCGCLNCGCFLLLLSVICLIALIAGFFDNPFRAIAAILGHIWHKLSGG